MGRARRSLVQTLVLLERGGSSSTAESMACYRVWRIRGCSGRECLLISTNMFLILRHLDVCVKVLSPWFRIFWWKVILFFNTFRGNSGSNLCFADEKANYFVMRKRFDSTLFFLIFSKFWCLLSKGFSLKSKQFTEIII